MTILDLDQALMPLIESALNENGLHFRHVIQKVFNLGNGEIECYNFRIQLDKCAYMYKKAKLLHAATNQCFNTFFNKAYLSQNWTNNMSGSIEITCIGGTAGFDIFAILECLASRISSTKLQLIVCKILTTERNWTNEFATLMKYAQKHFLKLRFDTIWCNSISEANIHSASHNSDLIIVTEESGTMMQIYVEKSTKAIKEGAILFYLGQHDPTSRNWIHQVTLDKSLRNVVSKDKDRVVTIIGLGDKPMTEVYSVYQWAIWEKQEVYEEFEPIKKVVPTSYNPPQATCTVDTASLVGAIGIAALGLIILGFRLLVLRR